MHSNLYFYIICPLIRGSLLAFLPPFSFIYAILHFVAFEALYEAFGTNAKEHYHSNGHYYCGTCTHFNF